MRKSFKIGVVGIGMVGKEVMNYFISQGYERGKNLFCYDNDSQKNFSDDPRQANIIFVCVPTPSNPDGSCNTKIVESVIKKFSNPDKNKVFVVKSTIEPGTTEKLQQQVDCPIIFNPEFLTESQAREDFIRPDRQLVAHTEKSLGQASLVLNLLPPAYFSSPGALDAYNFVGLNASEAEFGKYAANIFGAMKVTFGNIFADFCAGLEKTLVKEGLKVKIDYDNVRKAFAHDRRIGDAWLDVRHGNYRGFGGYCFPKDLNAFIAFGRKLEKKLTKKDKEKILIAKGLAFLEAIRDYNITLLKSQNLDLNELIGHNHQEVAKSKNAGKSISTKNRKPK